MTVKFPSSSLLLLLPLLLGLSLPLQAQESPSISRSPLHSKVWVGLTVSSYTIAGMDMIRTASKREQLLQSGGKWDEYDPLARPFIKLPRPAYYAVGFTLVTANTYLSYRMKQSHTWVRHIWWVPQVVQIGGNIWGYSITKISPVR